jgi:hypothetical protein
VKFFLLWSNKFCFTFFIFKPILLQFCQISIHSMFKFGRSKLPIEQHGDIRLVGIWTLYFWVQYYKLKVKFHYYGHFHYKCINTLPCEFWGGKKKLMWRTKVTKNRMYPLPFSTIFINKFFHRMIKVDKHNINEFLAQVQNTVLPFHDGSFFMNQTQFGSI